MWNPFGAVTWEWRRVSMGNGWEAFPFSSS